MHMQGIVQFPLIKIHCVLRKVPVAELIVHSDNNITQKIHDIALLKLGMK